MSSSATSTTHLPQELVDTVIDELKTDVGSLRACSLVSKPWVYRSRKYLFATVNLPTFLRRRWQECIAVRPNLDPHHHVRSLSLYPAAASAAFCIPETFADHLSSFIQVSRLIITSSLWEEWTDAFSDGALVAKYFGGFGQTLRKLELTRVHLNMVVLDALLDAFPRLEDILIFSPIMVHEEAKNVEAFPHLRERRSSAEVQEESPNAIVPYEGAPVRWVDSVTLLFPPEDLVVGLTNLPLHCRELVLAEGLDYGGDTFNLLLDSTGPTLESLTIRSTSDRGNTIFSHCMDIPVPNHDRNSPGSPVTLENCPVLHKLKTKAPYNGLLTYTDEQVRLIRTATSPFLGQIVFLGKWDDSQMDRTIDWLEPVSWENVDRELCNLMDRLDEEVKLEVVFADAVLSGGDDVKGVDCGRTDGVGATLLNGMRTRGGVVKIQRTAEYLK